MGWANVSKPNSNVSLTLIQARVLLPKLLGEADFHT